MSKSQTAVSKNLSVPKFLSPKTVGAENFVDAERLFGEKSFGRRQLSESLLLHVRKTFFSAENFLVLRWNFIEVYQVKVSHEQKPYCRAKKIVGAFFAENCRRQKICQPFSGADIFFGEHFFRRQLSESQKSFGA